MSIFCIFVFNFLSIFPFFSRLILKEVCCCRWPISLCNFIIMICINNKPITTNHLWFVTYKKKVGIIDNYLMFVITINCKIIDIKILQWYLCCSFMFVIIIDCKIIDIKLLQWHIHCNKLYVDILFRSSITMHAFCACVPPQMN